MANMSREEILDELISLGELPPQTWTKAKMRLRMEEIRVQRGTTANPRSKERTPMRTMMIQLNAAATKKATLAAEQLGVPLSNHETIADLKRNASWRSTIWHQLMDPTQWASELTQP